MSDMRKLLESIDSMSKAEKKPTGPKFTGYWKGTDKGTPGDKMVGSAQESIIKELDKTAKDTSTERKLKEEFDSFKEDVTEGIIDYAKDKWEELSAWDAGRAPKFTRRTRAQSKADAQKRVAANQKAIQAKTQKRNMPEGKDGVDTVTMDVPLMIRMLEYAREDAQTDMDLHNVAERMIELSQEGRTLTMDDYATICDLEHLEEYGNAQNPNAQTTTPGVAGAAQADAQNDAGAKTELVNTQKNLSKLKAVDPTLNPQLANQALQTIGNNPAATVGGAQLKQTQGLADLVGDALADPQRGSQLATILQQVQQSKKAK